MRPAPHFSLLDQNGIEHELEDYRGQWLVFYTYPKDGTSGCTQELCSFRDNEQELKLNELTVIGVSADSVESHQQFASEHDVSFTLLSDPDKKIIDAYGALDEDGNILRNTYIISPGGNIVATYEDVSPTDNVDEILEDIEDLQNA